MSNDGPNDGLHSSEQKPQDSASGGNVVSLSLNDRKVRRSTLARSNVEGNAVEWPTTFYMNKKGLHHEFQKKTGVEHIKLTGPFEILGEGRDPAGARRGFWLSWNDSDRRTHQCFVRRSDLVGAGVD